MRETPNLIVRT